MKHIHLKENMSLIGEKVVRKGERFIDYYIVISEQEKIFAFQRKYSSKTYDLCKSGIRINKLTILKTRDRGVMNLVDYVNIMLPFFAEYYELPLVS